MLQVTGIRYLLCTSPITWSTHHIYGHQSPTTRSLLLTARLNIQMDALAITFQSNVALCPETAAPLLQLYQEGWSIWAGHKKLVSPSCPVLNEHAYLPITQDNWTSSHGLLPTPRLSLHSWNLVDWGNVHTFMLHLPLGR